MIWPVGLGLALYVVHRAGLVHRLDPALQALQQGKVIELQHSHVVETM